MYRNFTPLTKTKMFILVSNNNLCNISPLLIHKFDDCNLNLNQSQSNSLNHFLHLKCLALFFCALLSSPLSNFFMFVVFCRAGSGTKFLTRAGVLPHSWAHILGLVDSNLGQKFALRLLCWIVVLLSKVLTVLFEALCLLLCRKLEIPS